MLELVETAIADIRIVLPRRHHDDRGFLSESYNRLEFAEAGLDLDLVQDNHVYTRRTGTIRGMHLQIAPRAQAKLVRVLRGAVLDVAVDLRPSSLTFGQHVAVELSAENGDQIFIPPGCAHGFCTLEDDTEVLYKVSDYWSPEHERGVRWNDPELSISWPVTEETATLNERDRELPLLRDTADLI